MGEGGREGGGVCKKGTRGQRSSTCWHRFGQTSVGTAEGLLPRKCVSWFVVVVGSSGRSVTHLLWDFVGVEDARDRHLDFVFLLLRLPQRRLPLLQEQVRGVLTCKLLPHRSKEMRLAGLHRPSRGGGG